MLDSFVGGGKADDSDSGGDDHFGVGMRGDGVHAFGAEKNGGERRAFEEGFEFGAEVAGGGFGRNGDELRTVAGGLFGGERDVGTGGERDDFEAAGIGVDDSESLAADGARGAQNRDAFHRGEHSTANPENSDVREKLN